MANGIIRKKHSQTFLSLFDFLTNKYLNGSTNLQIKEKYILFILNYSGGTPSFDEGDIIKITIPLKNIATAKVGPNSEMSVKMSVEVSVKKRQFCRN